MQLASTITGLAQPHGMSQMVSVSGYFYINEFYITNTAASSGIIRVYIGTSLLASYGILGSGGPVLWHKVAGAAPAACSLAGTQTHALPPWLCLLVWQVLMASFRAGLLDDVGQGPSAGWGTLVSIVLVVHS